LARAVLVEVHRRTGREFVNNVETLAPVRKHADPPTIAEVDVPLDLNRIQDLLHSRASSRSPPDTVACVQKRNLLLHYRDLLILADSGCNEGVDLIVELVNLRNNSVVDKVFNVDVDCGVKTCHCGR
jgi:hypothetical protein